MQAIPPQFRTHSDLDGSNGLPSSDQIIAKGVDAGEEWLLGKLGASPDVTKAFELISNIGADALEGYIVATTVATAASSAGLIAAGGALAAAIPVAGWVAGAVIAIIALFSVFGGNSCHVNVNGPTGPTTFDCEDYKNRVVPTAMRWVVDNLEQASKLTPAQFAVQASIWPFDWPIQGVPPYFFGVNPDGTPRVLPGAESMLHYAQLSMASALAGAYPTLLPLFRFTFRTNYPLLSDDEIRAICDRPEPLRAAFINAATNWAATNHADEAQIKARFPFLLPIDITTVVASVPTGYTPGDGGGGVVINPPVGGSASGQAHPRSMAVTVIRGIGIMAILGIAGVIAYSFYAKVPITVMAHRVLSKARNLLPKKLPHPHWPHFKHKGRRNPINLLPSATGGRLVAYRAQLGDPSVENVVITKLGNARLTRNGEHIVKFAPTTYQKTKIRAGRGEILIFTDQLIEG